jgi:hypothetical protein
MPTITIEVPSAPVIGPGSAVTLINDLVGPIPTDWFYEVEVDVPGNEVLVWNQTRISFGEHVAYLVLGVESSSSTVWPTAQTFPVDGTSVTVRARLLDTSSVIQSEGVRTDLTWTLQGNPLREILKEADPPSSLSALQQTQLAAAAGNTQLGFPTSIGGLLQVAANTLIAHPPIGVLSLAASPVTLIGRGSLTRPGLGLNVAAFGAYLSFFTVPAGFGRRDGAVPEFEERILQLATTHMLIDDSAEVITEIQDINTDGFLWLWGTALPQRILYDVTPGCVVILRWLEI